MTRSGYVALLLLTFSCGPSEAEPIQEVQLVTGHLRYQAEQDYLIADLVLPDSTTRPPIFQGRIMEPLRRLPARRFRFARQVDLRRPIRFTVEEPGQEAGRFSLRLQPVYLDSLPDTLRQDTTVQFMVADRGLAENESLVVSLQPLASGDERRILLTGPTRQGTVTLTSAMLRDVSPGDYRAFLIKQQRFRDQQHYWKVSLLAEYFTPARPLVVE